MELPRQFWCYLVTNFGAKQIPHQTVGLTEVQTCNTVSPLSLNARWSFTSQASREGKKGKLLEMDYMYVSTLFMAEYF